MNSAGGERNAINRDFGEETRLDEGEICLIELGRERMALIFVPSADRL